MRRSARQRVAGRRVLRHYSAAAATAAAARSSSTARLASASASAPFAGVIGLRWVSPGSFLSPQTRIASLADTDPLEYSQRSHPDLDVTSHGLTLWDLDREFGTGALKITPAHDFNDYDIGKRHELPMYNILTDDAALNDEVPEPYRGLDRFVARDKIVKEFEALGLLDGARTEREAAGEADHHHQPEDDAPHVLAERPVLRRDLFRLLALLGRLLGGAAGPAAL